MIDPFSVFFIQTSPKHSILKKKLNVKQKQYCNKFNTFKIFFFNLKLPSEQGTTQNIAVCLVSCV